MPPPYFNTTGQVLTGPQTGGMMVSYPGGTVTVTWHWTATTGTVQTIVLVNTGTGTAHFKMTVRGTMRSVTIPPGTTTVGRSQLHRWNLTTVTDINSESLVSP